MRFCKGFSRALISSGLFAAQVQATPSCYPAFKAETNYKAGTTVSASIVEHTTEPCAPDLTNQAINKSSLCNADGTRPVAITRTYNYRCVDGESSLFCQQGWPFDPASLYGQIVWEKLEECYVSPDRVPPGGAAFGGVTSSNACRDALVSSRDPSDGRLDRDAYVRFVNELSGDAFTSFQYDESGGWGMYPTTEFNHLPPLLRNEFYTQACGGAFIICDAFLYAGGADAGSDPSPDAQQEAYLSRLCLGVKRAIDEAMQEPAVTGKPSAEPTASPVTEQPTASPTTEQPTASPTTEQPTASPAVVLTAAVTLSSQVVVSEAGVTPASGGFADGRGPPSGEVASAATRNLTSFLIATLVTTMACLAAFVTYKRRRVLRRMRRELEDDAAKMKRKKERRRRRRRRRTGEEEEEISGVIHDVESQTSQDNTAVGSAEFSEMEGDDCDSNCIREEESEVWSLA